MNKSALKKHPEQDPAEGSSQVIERELNRQERKARTGSGPEIPGTRPGRCSRTPAATDLAGTIKQWDGW